ncbi:MAG: ribosome-associated translation inhibitor RaiA [Candidatus Omnitrophica bacterium]|nr:ribosome-associated translation inhibitor RaiA [Candidatus Omnitrophota bacterium]
MDIRISGRHFDVTEVLKEHVEKRVAVFEKYLDNLVDAHVILSVEKYRQCAEISVLGKHFKLTEKSIDTDMYKAVDAVCTRIETALRRHKDKTKVHRKKDGKRAIDLIEEQ